MLDQLNYDDFKDYRGKAFDLHGSGGRVEITLLDARLSPYLRTSLVRRQPFAILFAAPREPALGSTLYTIAHPGRGLIEGIFLSPVVPPEEDIERTRHLRFYEAVFN